MDPTTHAYNLRAQEYMEHLGSIEQMNEQDTTHIEGWAAQLPPGLVIDAGCGPGHWADYLNRQGRQCLGIDLAAQFLHQATRRFSATSFVRADLTALPVRSNIAAGILAWYSLIHLPAEQFWAALREFHRVLVPGGGVLLGFFDGPHGELFEHAITPARWWNPEKVAALAENSGFHLTGITTRRSKDHRPHAALAAQKRE